MSRTSLTFSKIWNLMTGQGGAGDHGSSGGVSMRPDRGVHEIEELLNHSQLTRTVCEAMAEDIVRAWRTHPKDGERWIAAEELFDARTVIERALVYSEAYGGAFIVPRYPGDVVTRDVLAKPFTKQRKGSLLGFDILAPHEMKIPTSSTLAIDPVTQLPTELEIVTQERTSTERLRIHSSWLHPVKGAIRYGRLTGNVSGRNNLQNMLGQSRVDIIFDDFVRVASGLQNLKHMLDKTNIDVLKIQGLADALKSCANTDEMQKVIQNLLMTATFTIQGANVYQPMVIDANEEMKRESLGSNNAPAIVSQFIDIFVAVSRIPRTRLLGEQAKGLGNGGDADLVLYYDRCGAMRERRATGAINFVDRLIGDDQALPVLEWEFNPLWQMSAKDKAETEAKQAETDSKYSGLDIPFMTTKIAERLSANATYSFSEAELAAIRETDGALDDFDTDPEPVEA